MFHIYRMEEDKDSYPPPRLFKSKILFAGQGYKGLVFEKKSVRNGFLLSCANYGGRLVKTESTAIQGICVDKGHCAGTFKGAHMRIGGKNSRGDIFRLVLFPNSKK